MDVYSHQLTNTIKHDLSYLNHTIQHDVSPLFYKVQGYLYEWLQHVQQPTIPFIVGSVFLFILILFFGFILMSYLATFLYVILWPTPSCHRLKKAQQLDAKSINRQEFESMFYPLTRLVYIMLGERTYARNTSNEFYFIFITGFYFVLFALATLFFIYFPLKTWGVIALISVCLVIFALPYRDANQSRFLGWLFAALGYSGLSTHYYFGLTIFGYHLEPYFYYGLLASGILGIWRRFWNYRVWKCLDFIVLKYYTKQGSIIPAQPQRGLS